MWHTINSVHLPRDIRLQYGALARSSSAADGKNSSGNASAQRTKILFGLRGFYFFPMDSSSTESDHQV